MMMGLQADPFASLSENSRVAVERMLRYQRKPIPRRPEGLEPFGGDGLDGLPKPLKPPVRITMQDDDDD